MKKCRSAIFIQSLAYHLGAPSLNPHVSSDQNPCWWVVLGGHTTWFIVDYYDPSREPRSQLVVQSKIKHTHSMVPNIWFHPNANHGFWVFFCWPGDGKMSHFQHVKLKACRLPAGRLSRRSLRSPFAWPIWIRWTLWLSSWKLCFKGPKHFRIFRSLVDTR